MGRGWGGARTRRSLVPPPQPLPAKGARASRPRHRPRAMHPAEPARDEAVHAAGEGRRVVGDFAVEDVGLVEQQLRQVRHVGIARAELGVGHGLDDRVAGVDLENRLCAGARTLARQQPLELPVRPRPLRHETGGAVRQPLRGPHVETRSPSAALTADTITASSTAVSFVSPSALGLSSSSGTRPKSTSPWLSDFSGLPSKPSCCEVQNASTGSVSSSTSTPRARAASSFGLDLRRSAVSPAR